MPAAIPLIAGAAASALVPAGLTFFGMSAATLIGGAVSMVTSNVLGAKTK